jgi:hypothetical protein
MAKILLGGVVTAIVGSIGGTTFKRTPYGFSFGKKSLGFTKNKSLSNKALGYLAQVRNDWNNLGTVEQNNWNDVAQTFEFPDKFGNPIKLTGRMLFIKSWGTLIQSGSSIKSAAEFNTNTDNFVLSLGTIDLNTDAIEIDITSPSSGQWYYFQVERIRKENQAPSFTRRYVCLRQNEVGDGTINLFLPMKAQFQTLEVDELYRVYVTAVNNSGYAGTVNWIDVELQSL